MRSEAEAGILKAHTLARVLAGFTTALSPDRRFGAILAKASIDTAGRSRFSGLRAVAANSRRPGLRRDPVVNTVNMPPRCVRPMCSRTAGQQQVSTTRTSSVVYNEPAGVGRGR